MSASSHENDPFWGNRTFQSPNSLPPDGSSIFAGTPNPFNTEPDSDMRIMARSNWHCYCAHVQEGFSPAQAMLIVQTIVSAALMQGPPEGNNND